MAARKKRRTKWSRQPDTRPSARQRGYDGAWERLRKRFLQGNPDCVACGDPAKHVDHIVSVREAPERRLDPLNLQSMCHSCHSQRTARDQPGGWHARRQAAKHATLPSGLPTDPDHPWVLEAANEDDER